jgi:hypothetical protein
MEHRPHLPHLHHHGEPTPDADGDLPIPAYDRLTEDELIHEELHRHTQAELERIEAYERAHEAREAILNKIHYLRGRQPWAGYDEMPGAEIAARLDHADTEVLKRVRDYEHKFRNRPTIVDRAMALVHERHLAEKQRETAPAYVPGGAAGRR